MDRLEESNNLQVNAKRDISDVIVDGVGVFCGLLLKLLFMAVCASFLFIFFALMTIFVTVPVMCVIANIIGVDPTSAFDCGFYISVGAYILTLICMYAHFFHDV